jgi:hypothetical protein
LAASVFPHLSIFFRLRFSCRLEKWIFRKSRASHSTYLIESQKITVLSSPNPISGDVFVVMIGSLFLNCRDKRGGVILIRRNRPEKE